MCTQPNITQSHWLQSKHLNKKDCVSFCENNSFIQKISASGKAIISGHSDGSLVRYIFAEENTSETHVRTTVN